MKMLSTGRVSLLGLMLAGVGVSNAVRESMSLTEGGVEFTVARYDDGRNKPYRLKMRRPDARRSIYMFDSATRVTDLTLLADERYQIIYDASDNLESVEQDLSPRGAPLAEDENEAAAAGEGRRLFFDDCTSAACEDAWHSLCAGTSSVCDLVDYGSPFSPAAAESIDTMCENFGSACSKYEAGEACQEFCNTEEAGGSTFSSNKCLDPANDNYKCTFSGETTMEFTECDLTQAEVPFLPACFEEFGKANIVRLLLDGSSVTEYDEGTFAGLSEMTFLDMYSNKLITVSEGLFDGLTKLEFLDMAFNDLVSLPEGAFSDLASLQILRIFNNELTPETIPIGLFSGTPLLKELYLSSNNLGDMTSLEGLFDGLTELTDLGLSEAGVSVVPAGLLTGLTKLVNLSFWINNLSSLPEGLLSGLPALQSLELTDNNLTELGTSLSGLTELRTLLLGYNDLPLTEDSFSELVKLEHLELAGTGLTTLPAGVFSPLVNLVRLELFDNPDLQCLPSTTATNIDIDEAVRDGTCECTPVDAVFCGDGLSCQGGMTGYTCVA